MHFDLDTKVQELHTYIDKWKEEVRQALNLPAAGASVGVSFLPELQLPRVPETVIVNPGIYMSRHGNIRVEVIQQAQGQVVFEVAHESGALTTQAMTASFFEMLFVPVSGDAPQV